MNFRQHCTTCNLYIPRELIKSDSFTQWIHEHKSEDEAFLVKYGRYPDNSDALIWMRRRK